MCNVLRRSPALAETLARAVTRVFRSLDTEYSSLLRGTSKRCHASGLQATSKLAAW